MSCREKVRDRASPSIAGATGLSATEGKTEALAERKLAAYILSKHDPEKAVSKGDPNSVKIADILTLEMHRIAKSERPDARKRELIAELQRIGN